MNERKSKITMGDGSKGMKMRMLYHALCHESGMGFLVPDIENSTDMFHKYQCMNCGKKAILSCDQDVETVLAKPGETRLYYIKNAKTTESLLVDGRFLIVFEDEKQANKFANMYNINGYEVKSDQYIYGDKTNGHYLVEEGEEENGKQSEEKK